MTCVSPIRTWRWKAYPLDCKTDEEKLKRFKKLHFLKYESPPFKYEKYIEYINIPCGKCIGCMLDRSNNWAVRMSLEKKQWKDSCFITLTYNNKNLPKNNKLCERDMQLFLKKLRKNETGTEEWINPKTKKKEKPIRYLYCGEHGTKNNRPHYHIALFNYIPKDLKYYKKSDGSGKPLFTSKTIEKLWGKGFAPIGEITYESACYIARYVQKKAYQTEKTDEFIRMSRMPGLGITEWENNKEKIKKTGNILIKNEKGVIPKKIPRYFLKQWENENWFTYEQFKNKMKEKGVKNATEQKKQINSSSFIDNREFIILDTNKTLLEHKAKFLVRKI